MNIKRLRKKYLKAQTKANRLREKYVTLYLKECTKYYILSDNRATKTFLNSWYGSQVYKDTDSIIYSDFNKKQET